MSFWTSMASSISPPPTRLAGPRRQHPGEPVRGRLARAQRLHFRATRGGSSRGRIRADRSAPIRHARLDGRDLDPAPDLRLVDRPPDHSLPAGTEADFLGARALARHAYNLRSGPQAANDRT